MRTFNLVVLAILGLFIVSCDDDDRLGDWEKSIQFSGAGREGAICFKDEATQTVFVGLGFGTEVRNSQICINLMERTGLK